MTANRPAPDTDALARVIAPEVPMLHGVEGSPDHVTLAIRRAARNAAARVLAAIESDPDVQAAALAALTRGGALEDQWMHKNASGGGAITRTLEQAKAEEAEYVHRREFRSLLEPLMPESIGIRHRLVAPWREVE